jgi:hypothetical protein
MYAASPKKKARKLSELFKSEQLDSIESPLPFKSRFPIISQNDIEKTHNPITTEILQDENSKCSQSLDDVVMPIKKHFVLLNCTVTFQGMSQKIIDTPEYQRLHKLKQLGTCDFVFRSATHTRFEHSLGVANLAARQARVFQMNQPNLNITDIDICCVELAGLCHDLGHGPYSHVFDGVFVKAMFPNGIDGAGKKWRHEDGSVNMLRYIISKNNINPSAYGFSAADIAFVEEIIGGVNPNARVGRPRHKHFLYGMQ